MSLFAIALLIFVPMLVEAGRAARNERAQRARGGIEPQDDVYPIMRIVYPAVFLAMLVEGAVRGIPSTVVFGSGRRGLRLRQSSSSGPRFSRWDGAGPSA